jgi:hypothetical protein
VAGARRQLELVLGSLDTQAIATTDTYIASLHNLLEGVERRRNTMQSPLRKVWRYLRTQPFGSLWLSLAAGIAIFLLTWPIAALTSDPVSHTPYLAGWQALLLGLAVGLFVGAVALCVIQMMAALSKASYERYLSSYLKLSGPSLATKSEALDGLHSLHKAELWWNLRLGEKESGEIDPLKFGEPLPVPDLSATTAAKVLLETSDRQRDQEDSRLRWLRVLAVLVGIVLASLLHVDAAVLLSAAVPGLAAKINVFTVEIVGLIITPGILLTGLAASAGSAFWHDQLDRLQFVKKQAEAGARLAQQIRGNGQQDG